MAPPTSAAASKAVARHESVERARGRGTTPSAVNPGKAVGGNVKDNELSTTLKSDLTDIRNLVTCSICDQLLYEPWTLACGHTYCYSCLCNWFIPNKRKKSCPECRTRVHQIPAPNYLVKQMVEVFTNRSQLMPSDESVDQHAKKRAEEIAEVDRDKTGPQGLFKGTFPANGGPGRPLRDEADHVYRCPGCHHELEGGPRCENCGLDVEDDEIDYEMYSDMDGEDLEHLDGLSLDLQEEFDADLELDEMRHPYYDMHHVRLDHARIHHRFQHPIARPRHYDPSNSDTSEMYSDAEEDEEGSLQDFVAPDDEEAPSSPVHRPGNQRAISISNDESDESDEGGAISNRMPQRRMRAHIRISTPPSAFSVTDSVTNGSDAGDMNSESDMLRNAGWSPLNQEMDSEAEGIYPFRNDNYEDGYESSEDGATDRESDTETMVGNGDSGDLEDRSREDYSETPTPSYAGPPYIPHEHMPENYESLDEDADDDDSEAEGSSVYDRDGDTEMSASPKPRPSRSASVNTDGYGDQNDYPSGSERSISHAPDAPDPFEADPYGGDQWGNLGGTNRIHDVELDDESDDSIRPPPRRRPIRFNQDVQVQQQYDPRISRLFADHQQSLRGAEPARMITLSEETRRYESRNRRMTAYRSQPSRRNDPLRSSRSPSANRIIASSSRIARPPRQYMARGHN